MNNFKNLILVSILFFVLALSCASKKVLSTESEFRIPISSEANSSVPPELELHPEIEGENQKNRLFSFSAKETPLEDILVYIASEAGLNIVWGKGVNPRVLVTVSFQNQTLDEALETILSSTEYLYSMNSPSLQIKLYDTWRFELGEVPNKISSSVSVGGDVLGSNSEIGGVSGRFQISSQTREESVDLWKQMEEGLSKLVSPEGDYFINKLGGIIVVTDRKKNLKEIKSFVHQVKSSLGRQVIIEAEVLEVTLKDQKSYGIDWSSLISALVEDHKININVSQSLSLPGSVFEITGSTPDNTFLFNTLGEYGKVKVLSKPRLNVLNGQTAMINVGKVQAYWEITGLSGGVEVGQPVTVPEMKTALLGLLMGVTPYISSDGYVTLHVVPIITNLNQWEEFKYQGVTLKAPVLDIREMSTTVGMKNGESVILGGLITTKKSENQKKIPLLGDIPVLGFFFRRDERVEERAELVIILTPRVTQLSYKEE